MARDAGMDLLMPRRPWSRDAPRPFAPPVSSPHRSPYRGGACPARP